MMEHLPPEMSRAVEIRDALADAENAVTRQWWIETFDRINGPTYGGYAEEKWWAVQSGPLAYLAYFSGPGGKELAAEAWAKVRAQLPADVLALLQPREETK